MISEVTVVAKVFLYFPSGVRQHYIKLPGTREELYVVCW